MAVQGTIVVQLGNEEPIASMDASGKLVVAKHNEITSVDIKKASSPALARVSAGARE